MVQTVIIQAIQEVIMIYIKKIIGNNTLTVSCLSLIADITKREIKRLFSKETKVKGQKV